MRDIAHIIILIGLIVSLWKRPWIGALGFTWFSFMNSHRLTFGFANDFPFAMILAACTIVALLITKERRSLPASPMLVFWLLLLFWMCVSAANGITDPNDIAEQFKTVLKIQLMGFILFMLVFTKVAIISSVAVMCLSISFYGIKGGMFTLMTGGAYRVWGPPNTYIEGNNELALALVMMLPIMYFLSTQLPKKWQRNAFYVAMLMSVFAILGSHSRGAFLAILAITVVLGLRSKYPVAVLGAMGVVLVLAMAFMPDNWTDRMNTIQTYEKDMSANQRLTTWTMIWNLASDRPFLGAGFRLDNPGLYIKYLGEVRYGVTQAGPHSIYFQALGESGFPGLFLYLGLGISAWFYGSRLSKMFAGMPGQEWVINLVRMIQAGMLGFAAGGAFLGLMHWDAPYYLIGVYFMLHNYHIELTKQSQSTTPAVLDKYKSFVRKRPA